MVAGSDRNIRTTHLHSWFVSNVGVVSYFRMESERLTTSTDVHTVEGKGGEKDRECDGTEPGTSGTEMEKETRNRGNLRLLIEKVMSEKRGTNQGRAQP